MVSTETRQVMCTLAVIAFAVIVSVAVFIMVVESDKKVKEIEPDPTRVISGTISRAEKTWYHSGLGGYVQYTTIWINGESIHLNGDVDLAVGKLYEITYNSKTGELIDARLLEGQP